jgi:hypothetical protein
MRRATLLILAILLTGCAAGVKVTYSRLDWLITSWAGNYVDLDPAQKQILRASVQDIHAWHCRTHLPRYAVWLTTIDSGLTRTGSSVDIDSWYREFNTAWHELVNLAVPALAQVGATLTDAQVAQLLARVETGHRKYYRETVDLAPDRLRAHYDDAMRDELERWTGRLTPAQRQRVTRWSGQIELLQAERRALREQWRADLAAALALRHQRPEFERRLHRLLAGNGMRGNDNYRTSYAANTRRVLTLIADIANDLTPEQRRRVSGKLALYASTFSSLECAAPATALRTASANP